MVPTANWDDFLDLQMFNLPGSLICDESGELLDWQRFRSLILPCDEDSCRS